MFERNEVSFLGYDIAVSFGEEMIISFGCEREVGLLSLHQSRAFIGKIEVVILPAYPYNGVGAQISLLNAVKRITFKVIRKLVY